MKHCGNFVKKMINFIDKKNNTLNEFINLIKTDTGSQVQFIDSRYYRKNETYYPGVSTILNTLSKGKQYENWLKSSGFNADVLAREAMEQGSHVHEAIQMLCMGLDISFGEIGKPNYTRNEWVMISRFIDFYENFKPEIIAVEKVIVSDVLQFGSQLDLVCKLNDELIIIDHKTGSMYDTAYMQLAAYQQLWNEYFPETPAVKCAVLHLDSSHKGRDKSGKSIQGQGWKLYEVENIDNHWEDFKHLQALWKRQNPDYKPFNQIYPYNFKLNLENKTGSDS